MSLMQTWGPQFHISVRNKGRLYQQQGRVRQVSAENGETVRAEVEGSRTYIVTLSQAGGQARVTCTCPHFASGQYCKHIYATLLDITHNGITGGDDTEQGEATGAGVAQAVELTDGAPPPPPKARRRQGPARHVMPAEPEWVGRLSLLRPSSSLFVEGEGNGGAATSPAANVRQVCYVVSAELSRQHNGLVVELFQRTPIRTGWSALKRMRIAPGTLGELYDPVDRELCALLLGAASVGESNLSWNPGYERPMDGYRVLASARLTMLKRLIETGRCYLDDSESFTDEPTTQPLALTWDDHGPWMLWLVGSEDSDAVELQVTVELRRGDERAEVTRPRLMLGGENGLVILGGVAAPLDDRDAFVWASQFREALRDKGDVEPIRVPLADVERFLDRLYLLPNLPEIELPAGVAREERHMEPVPHFELFSPRSGGAGGGSGDDDEGRSVGKGMLTGRLWFAYDRYRIVPGQPGRFVPATAVASDLSTDEAELVEATNDKTKAARLSDDDAPQSPVEDGATDQSATPSRVLLRRDLRKEEEALASLVTLGYRPEASLGDGQTLGGTLAVKLMPVVVGTLLRRGWMVTADRRDIRQAGAPSLSITSGIDWFELHGGVKFQSQEGEQTVGLPEILKALRRGESMVTLGDGTQGLLPEQWLKDHGLLWSIGQVEDDHLRYRISQAALLDALLDEQALMDVDAKFAEARERLRHFEGVAPLDAPPSFIGELRPYQRDGLGWLAFLRWFGMGGILADDMGLGKTIQVLAMLDDHYAVARQAREAAGDDTGSGANRNRNNGQSKDETSPPHRPTLVVAPRSVVFNWLDEAAKFTPGLRVLSYNGVERIAMREAFDQYDLIVTSFGLMRRDIQELRKHPFHYLVLDEAQAIKNPGSQVAKASRLLTAEHRLALTGTPVENHLGDLWSIFEFLNPGMLGSATHFGDLVKWAAQESRLARSRATGQTQAGDIGLGISDNGEGDDETDLESQGTAAGDAMRSTHIATQVGRSLRPFILRRTKRQVLDDLPEKTEQTIHCEMESAQRKVYDDLLRHYRGALLAQSGGMTGGGSGGNSGGGSALSGAGGNSMIVLEALLRLRQAACHPGLIDPSRVDEPSAKLEALLENVRELMAEGHKALIFSQFTSFLAIVRKRLEAENIRYEYLDGQTRHRKQRVQRFQTDPDCPLFLISLKAGGLGLNLTAADYVFILDPWWNPAVENQAIDRAHRIGQTQHVFAYRMICENTVEQRIAELQDKKRNLADAIIGEQQESLLQSLTRDDLERLLS